MTLPIPHDPMRLYAHAVRAGDTRLAQLIACRLHLDHAPGRASPPDARDALVERIVSTLRTRLGIAGAARARPHQRREPPAP